MHIRSMDFFSRYIHNNKSFCENFSFPKSINKGRMTITKVPNESFPLSSLPLMVLRVLEEI